MDKIIDVLSYILEKYPKLDDLSNARTTKLVYLSDWKNCLENNAQITKIEWVYNNFGPYVWDVLRTAEKHPSIITVSKTKSNDGTPHYKFKLNRSYQVDLSENEKQAIDHVIKVTKDLDWDEFIRLVYSTYPILTSERYARLNLIELAKKYKEQNIKINSRISSE